MNMNSGDAKVEDVVRLGQIKQELKESRQLNLPLVI
jgi:hypothetical protein